MTNEATKLKTTAASSGQVDKIVRPAMEKQIDFDDILPFLPKFFFFRGNVSEAICLYFGENKSRTLYSSEASRILKKARSDKKIRFLHGRERSCYYEVVHNAIITGRGDANEI